MNDMLNLRIPTDEKHALRILAAEDNLNLTKYVLKVLRNNTSITELASLLAKLPPHMENNNPLHVDEDQKTHIA